jgi:integrase
LTVGLTAFAAEPLEVTMATIKKRGKKYVVIYSFLNEFGEKKHKWESVATFQDAKALKTKIESEKVENSFVSPSTKTVRVFLDEWVKIYSKSNWAFKTYMGNMSLLKNHILPNIGDLEMQKVTPLVIEQLYDKLRVKKVGDSRSYSTAKADLPCLSSTTIRLIHTLLKKAFAKAVEWKLVNANPVICEAPKKLKTGKTIWDAETALQALEEIQHEQLHLAVHLAFICTLRIGEILGLTWDCVDLEAGTIRINKTIQRVERRALDLLPPENLIMVFPPSKTDAKSVIILKSPKTETSKRKNFITKPLIAELRRRREQIVKDKAYLGDVYTDYNLVFSGDSGYPVEPARCEKWIKKWLASTPNPYPNIIFHELRHSSTTYKLAVSGGDLKSVQGDTGHASSKMVADTYSHIQDTSRARLMNSVETQFYTSATESGQNTITGILDLVKNDVSLQSALLNALGAKLAI